MTADEGTALLAASGAVSFAIVLEPNFVPGVLVDFVQQLPNRVGGWRWNDFEAQPRLSIAAVQQFAYRRHRMSAYALTAAE
jgi:hypothetical protein